MTKAQKAMLKDYGRQVRRIARASGSYYDPSAVIWKMIQECRRLVRRHESSGR